MKPFKDFIKEDWGKPEFFTIEKGLSQEEAYKKALPKVKHDFRGFNYNPTTGKCKFT